MEEEFPYYKLPTNASQQTLKAVDNSFKSFFSLLKKKSQGKYDKDVRIPNYLDKEGKYKVIFTKIHIRFNGKYALLTLRLMRDYEHVLHTSQQLGEHGQEYVLVCQAL